MITDDVLRVDFVDDVPQCRLGGRELRLRKSAAELSSLFGQAPGARVTADGRDALAPRRATSDRLPLAAIVVPFPRRDINAVSVRRLAPMDALLLLVRFPRLLGWTDESVQVTQLAHLSVLCEQVPCYTIEVPWGPPFAESIASTVLAEVGLLH